MHSHSTSTVFELQISILHVHMKSAALKFSASGWSKQANIHTHVHNEVTLACMGLAQARPNYCVVQ